MHCYEVIIEYCNHRENRLIKWAENKEEAKWLAMRDWGMPIKYISIKVLNSIERREYDRRHDLKMEQVF